MLDRPSLRERHAAGEPIRAIARTGPSRNAVRRALAPGGRDRYHRPSATEAAEPAVRDVLADYPHMTVADIAVVIDWRHSRRALSDLVARLRPEYASEREVHARPLATIQVGRRLTAGTMQLGRLEL